MANLLKNSLLTVYFSARELRDAVRGMYTEPAMHLVTSDYDDYWRHRELSGMQPRFEIIARGIRETESILDVGCGDGAMLEYLHQRGLKRCEGIDISEVAVAKARSRSVVASTGTVFDLRATRREGAYDHVVMSEIIEHVPNPEEFVQVGWELARRSLWLTFPNIGYFPHRLRLLCGKFPVQWVLFPGEHLRFWTLTDFRIWLRRLGLPSGVVTPSNGIRVLHLHRVCPNLMANQIVVRLEK